MEKRVGAQSVKFNDPPYLVSSASIVGKMEDEGKLRGKYDVVLEDDTWGEKSWEHAERKMFEQTVRLTLNKCGLKTGDVDCLLGGDLLNQLVSANYAARELQTPFIGMYGACSVMAESLLVASMLVDGGFVSTAACVAGSHFSTAERQFRMPLELGNQVQPTAQRTVTGVGCAILCAQPLTNGLSLYQNIRAVGGTLGRVLDYGITDVSNMGAAMAPAAADTIATHLTDWGRTPSDYDLIVTGDLGRFGVQMLHELLAERGVDLTGRHLDCGMTVFAPEQDVQCGASGCGCSAIVLSAHLLGKLEAGDYRRILFVATGALMSPATNMQGDTIPCIAHGVILERSAT